MSAAFAGLAWLRPDALWALLALPLIAWAWRWRRRRSDIWRKAVDPHLLPHLLDRKVARGGIASLALQCIAWTLAVLALAGPSWRSGEQPLAGAGAPLVIALDLSSATLAADLPPSRLLQARAKLAALLRARNGEPTALVVYAQDAFTVSPLSEDTANIALFLDALAPDVMPVDGSDAGRAIDLASQLLAQAGHAQGDILLLGDHAGGDARAAASAAAAQGHRVSVLGMGTAAGAAYRRGDGSIARTRLDAASLRGIASAGGGRYHDWNAGSDAIASSATRQDGTRATGGPGARARLDEGYWLLPLLMLLALFAFRRGAAVAVLAGCMLLPGLPAQASGEGGPWRRADQVQHARMRDGISAYRAGDDTAALQAWQGLPGADAAYNRGNALARQGRYEEAVAAYDDALREQPGMADALANRRAVEAAMRRKPPAGGDRRDDRADARDPAQEPSQGQPESSAPAADEPGQGDGDVPQSQDRRPQGDTSRSQQRQADEARVPPPRVDADAQRDADDAQRRQMQRALQQQGGTRADDGDRVDGTPERAESAAQREKRQANEAWLRRIQDDPGGLLRAKFKLEHERRNGAGGTR